MNIEYNAIVERILDYLETLPSGKEICTFEAIVKVFGSDCMINNSFTINGQIIEHLDLMQIDRAIKNSAHTHNLILDSSKKDGMALGLPYNIGYIIKRK